MSETKAPWDERRSSYWASTMAGHATEDVRLAHADSHVRVEVDRTWDRTRREESQDRQMATGATRASGAGRRPTEEQPDHHRTCFERDRDRILHGTTAFRRLAGKTQVFIFPEDHQRTRLTHALEVAQIATAIATTLNLNVALAEAIALGHDCGHGPGGHASEDAFAPYLIEGYDHAVWGADEVLTPLNLCLETSDGIRNHSWSRPAPSTPEGEVVSWADRIAYVCHDFEDAVHAGIISMDMLSPDVTEVIGTDRRRQLDVFIGAVVDAAQGTGQIGMSHSAADALAAFRRFNYEHIYMRRASVEQSEAVIKVLRGLVDYYSDRPNTLLFDLPTEPGSNVASRLGHLRAGSDDAVRAAVKYVAGMTDRYAFSTAVAKLGWERSSLPQGVDVF